MKYQIGATAAVLICLIIGITFQQEPYEIRKILTEGDQHALDHRDSPYSHVSWITSDSGNYAQLRFFDKVEGGVCLSPSWDEYAALSKEQPTLAHLVNKEPWPPRGKPGKTWPQGKAQPNPGTLSNTKYVCLFPTAVLLNRDLIKDSQGDLRNSKPNIIIVGLGSAIGISVFAHHFPEASITVVDIDQVVIDMVYDHYPFIDWLSKQKCSDGRPRLKIAAGDARQFLHYPEMRNDNGMKYDIAILDAYTSGSTIPSHLMTLEFFKEIKKILRPNGILMSNIIGSYTGKKRLVVGGAMRCMQEAGFTHIHNFPIVEHPILNQEELNSINVNNGRNNIILACASELDPIKHKAAWEELRAFIPYADLSSNKAVTEKIILLKKKSDGYQFISSVVGLPPLDPSTIKKFRDAAKEKTMNVLKGKKTFAPYDDYANGIVTDQAAVDKCYEAVKAQWGKEMPLGWKRKPKEAAIFYAKRDWVRYARRTFQRSMMAARARSDGGFLHDAKNIVGAADSENREHTLIPDAPVYSDAQPNADIYNR